MGDFVVIPVDPNDPIHKNYGHSFNYQLVSDNIFNEESFIAEVNQKLQDGYILVGGPFIANKKVICQAMYFPKPL